MTASTANNVAANLGLPDNSAAPPLNLPTYPVNVCPSTAV
jgi:hypothetical protein